MKIPKSLQNLVESFSRLPGIGEKTASRLAFYILKSDNEEVRDFATNLLELKNKLSLCSNCFNVCEETETCSICSDTSRDANKVCVVENILNLIAVENTNYDGVYHVLGGVLNPLSGINAQDIKLEELFSRLQNLIEKGRESDENFKLELIIATNPTMEGESTALFIKRNLEQRDLLKHIKITRIGRGIPTGGDIEFADKTTIDNAIMGRVEF